MRRIPSKSSNVAGFTLIELSIVLVIIGLIVGGILVGQDLIGAAGVRAQITQIEKYNTAVNTFYSKYQALPGDMNNTTALQFGFAQRGSGAGQGDGNGIIEGADATDAGCMEMGETTLFWVDLSMANLIDGSFNTAVATRTYANITVTTLNAWLPQAKLGQGNYIYVWSGGWQEWGFSGSGDMRNYFAISAATEIHGTSQGELYSSPGLTVQQAYRIDSKVDDGLPQSGNVIAVYLDGQNFWAAGGGVQGAWQWGGPSGFSEAPTHNATPGSATTCYDNSATSSGTPGVAGAAQHYSLEMSAGSNVNCALSFKFQ